LTFFFLIFTYFDFRYFLKEFFLENMANQTNEIKLSLSTSPTSTIRSKLEQIQKQSLLLKRKRPISKVNEEIIEDFLVSDNNQHLKQDNNTDNKQTTIFKNDILKEEKDDASELVEFSRGYTNKSALCIWHNGIFF
jgi:hypothetical protein